MKSSKLTSVIIHLTNACANRCPYCYAYTGENVHFANLTTIYRILDELVNYGVSAVSFLGGDPLLHPDIEEFIKYANSHGLKVTVMSNSMDFKSMNLTDVTNIVSCFETTIHGDCAEQHDAFCKHEGAYEELVFNLKALSDRGAKIGIALNIIPDNCTNMYSMIQSLVKVEKINISYIIMQRIVSMGKACGSSDYKLTKEQANAALEQIAKIDRDFGINITVEDPFPLCVIDSVYHKYMRACEWGFTKAAINLNGDFSRCGADPRCLLGNILKTPISEIWETSPILKSFRNRDYLSDDCKKCPLVERCGGGCPLSCESNNDQGIDYLLSEYRK